MNLKNGRVSRDSIMESDKENHPPNRPKPVVAQEDARLSLKINLCHMKRLSELMNENLSTLNDIFNDSSLLDATKIRNARSTVNLLNRCFGQVDVQIQDCMKNSSCLDFSRRYLSEMKATENAKVNDPSFWSNRVATKRENTIILQNLSNHSPNLSKVSTIKLYLL
jgi:hypothetical protein